MTGHQLRVDHIDNGEVIAGAGCTCGYWNDAVVGQPAHECVRDAIRHVLAEG